MKKNLLLVMMALPLMIIDKMKKQVYYLTMIFAGILLISSCGEKDPDPGPEPPPPPPTVTVTGVTLNKTTLTLEVGDSEDLTAAVAPQNATIQAVAWSSSNEAVATVGNDGKVTAVAAGSTTITVTTADGGKTATCEVTVESPYYATFKYDGVAYKIADEKTCIFTKHSDTYYVVNCSDAETKQALTISISKNLEPGRTYDIYAGSIYVMTDIKLLFTAGETIAEESFCTDDMEQTGIIGELTVTELTDELLSGTFKCRTMNGEITDGRFNVKAREYE
jgi:hypothetical protein